MKTTKRMQSYWTQALVAVLVMGGLGAVTTTPAWALSLWGPTEADGRPSTGFVMPGTYTNGEAPVGQAGSACAMGPFEARDTAGTVTWEYRVTRKRPDQAAPDLNLVQRGAGSPLRDLYTSNTQPYHERTYEIRGVTQISPVYFQIIVNDGFQTLTSKAYELWITAPGTGADTRECGSASDTMAMVAEGPLEVASAAPVGLTKAPVGLTPDHNNKFIYEWDETFLYNKRFPTPTPFDIEFSFSAPVAVSDTRMRYEVLEVSGGRITGIAERTNWDRLDRDDSARQAEPLLAQAGRLLRHSQPQRLAVWDMPGHRCHLYRGWARTGEREAHQHRAARLSTDA